MAKKKDPSVTFLNKWGYNVVKLPRAGIEPLDVVGHDKGTQWLGPLASVWTSKSPAPVPGPPRPAATVNGQKTDALDLDLGLHVLGNTLAAFGASIPSLDLAYKQARTVQFSYTGVELTVISPLDAGNYLAGGELRTDNPVVRTYFQNPDCQAFLVTSVLKSGSITVTAQDEHGVGVGVDVPAISGLVGAKVGVKAHDASNSTVTFVGPEPVTFGFAAQRIMYVNGMWSLQEAPTSGEMAFGSGNGEAAEHGTAKAKAQRGVVLATGPLDCCLDLRYEAP